MTRSFMLLRHFLLMFGVSSISCQYFAGSKSLAPSFWVEYARHFKPGLQVCVTKLRLIHLLSYTGVVQLKVFGKEHHPLCCLVLMQDLFNVTP